MRKHLTQANIETLKRPNAGSIDVFDMAYPGLSLRVTHTGVKTFVLHYRKDGKSQRSAIGRWPQVTLQDAHDAWREHRDGIEAGEAPKPITLKTGSEGLFEVVVQEWLQKDQAEKCNAKTLGDVQRVVKNDLMPVWQGKPVENITREDVIALLDGIIGRGCKAMAWKVHGNLRRFFKWCLNRGIIKADPIAGMERMGSANKRDRILTNAELREVYRAASRIGPNGSAVMLLVLTGARREEIGGLKWAEVDFQSNSLKLSADRTKNGDRDCKPLSTVAVDLLKAIERTDSPYVFGKTGIRNWGGIKEKVDKLSGVQDWVIHDLRRCVSTGLNEMGVAPHVVEAILGHRVNGVAAHYNYAAYQDMKREALQQWAKHVMTLVM